MKARPIIHPSVHMLRLVKHLAETGADLNSDGGGVLIIVYAVIDQYGVGQEGMRYRLANSAAGVELIPE
ncbi:MAG TPA: hypothetical protein VNH18_10410 [Bryobacteraceae bacterium]|nr:hypothetical protein [Bryobacteraceae bacterium]